MNDEKRIKKHSRWFKLLRFWYYTFVQFFLPVRRLGHKEPFSGGPYVIVANHHSVYDVIPAAVATRMPLHFIAKNELAKKPLGRWFVKKSQCILVERDGRDVRGLMQSLKYLKNGESICIFPEGTRNKTDETFAPFKGGVAVMAIRTKTPLILMVHCKRMRFFRRNYFYFSDPIELSEFYDRQLTDEVIAEADEKLRSMMLEMHNELVEMLNSKKNKKK